MPLPPHLRTRAAQLRQQRQIRALYLGTDLLGEPCWDMLLALAEAAGPLPVTSVTGAACAPATTALRHLQLLDAAELVISSDHPTDRRARLITLSQRGEAALTSYLERAVP